MTDTDEIAIVLCGGPMDGLETTTAGPSPAPQLTMYHAAGRTAVAYRLSRRTAGDGSRVRYDYAWQAQKGGPMEGPAAPPPADQTP